jgi:hypothetical protein
MLLVFEARVRTENTMYKSYQAITPQLRQTFLLSAYSEPRHSARMSFCINFHMRVDRNALKPMPENSQRPTEIRRSTGPWEAEYRTDLSSPPLGQKEGRTRTRTGVSRISELIKI